MKATASQILYLPHMVLEPCMSTLHGSIYPVESRIAKLTVDSYVSICAIGVVSICAIGVHFVFLLYHLVFLVFFVVAVER